MRASLDNAGDDLDHGDTKLANAPFDDRNVPSHQRRRNGKRTQLRGCDSLPMKHSHIHDDDRNTSDSAYSTDPWRSSHDHCIKPSEDSSSSNEDLACLGLLI